MSVMKGFLYDSCLANKKLMKLLTIHDPGLDHEAMGGTLSQCEDLTYIPVTITCGGWTMNCNSCTGVQIHSA